MKKLKRRRLRLSICYQLSTFSYPSAYGAIRAVLMFDHPPTGWYFSSRMPRSSICSASPSICGETLNVCGYVFARRQTFLSRFVIFITDSTFFCLYACNRPHFSTRMESGFSQGSIRLFFSQENVPTRFLISRKPD